MSYSTSSDDRGVAHLMELATPELYQRNAFRVLGQRVEVETGDARRRKKQMERRKALGLGSGSSASIMPLSESVGESDLQLALQRIQDPVSRLLDEFFWFWSKDGEGGNGADDEALQLLEERKLAEAVRLFESREAGGDISASHNLAVYHHLTALDLELRSQSETLSDTDRAAREASWRQCLPRWKKLLDDENTWSRIRERINELDDPRLRAEFAGHLRESLEEAVLLINARLAVSAAEAHRSEEVGRQVAILQSSGFSPHLIASAMRRCLWPIDLRIRTICDRSEKTIDADAHSGQKMGEQLLAETLPPLRLIDQMLPADDPLRQGLHDEVARVGLRCQIVYGNKTDDWRSCKAGLERLLRDLSPSVSLRDRILENLKIMGDNLQLGQCFYCQDHMSVEGCGYEVPMYGDVQTTWTGYKTYRVTWRHVAIKVPRCPRCQANHDAIGWQSFWAGFLTFVVCALAAWITFSVWKPKGGDAFSSYLFVGGGLLGGTALLTWLASYIAYQVGMNNVGYQMRGATDYEDYSSISQLRMQGWQYGSEPPS